MNSKILIILSIALFSLISLPAHAQSDENIVDKISTAIKAADAKKVAEYFYSTINLEVGEVDGSYSKKQAEMILEDFFKKEPVKSFVIKHKGSSNNGSKYAIGNYKSESKEFRVYFLLKKEKNSLLLHQLQFEEE